MASSSVSTGGEASFWPPVSNTPEHHRVDRESMVVSLS